MLYSLILQLLDERTEQMRKKGECNGPFSVALARNLTGLEIFGYAKTHEQSFSRIKEDNLRRSVDRMLKTIMDDEEEEMKNMGVDPISLAEQEEDDNGEKLMEVKDTNQANKSITDMWKGTDTENVSTDGERDTEAEGAGATSLEGSILDKKRARKKVSLSSGRSKRFKAAKDRSPPDLKLSSLGGLDNVVSELMETVGMPILHPEIYVATGIQPPRGVLLHGPPGCGKTTIANALAGELQVPFISLSAPSVVSGMSGESEKKVREIFEEAKRLAPCLVFFDEIDAITPKRDGGAQREMEKRIVAQLLTCMDNLSLENTGGKPVIVIGATNRPDSLDSALRRAGRFDREICINVPDEVGRYKILESMTRKLKSSGDLGLDDIAKMTPGFVGADLKSLVTAAGIAAIKRIFGALAEQKKLNDAIEGDMEVDIEERENFEVIEFGNAGTTGGTVIQNFLINHPDTLTPEQLEPLSISKADFVSALPTIQPTAKREGFATIPDVTWDHVGALAEVRVELHMAIVQPIKRPDIYLKVGITAPGGVLMWGPPGCGKTLLAKAVANESKANFISVKGPELLNKFVGESERAVRKVFARARASVPCIIFFDELDALVPRRDAALSEASSRVVNTLLTELDGLNDRRGIFVIGATNRPDMIDPAMLRPGRLDKTLYVKLPTAPERLEILRTLVRSNHTPIDDTVDLATIAYDERCGNFSGADLSSLVKEASVISLKRIFFKGIDEGNETVSVDPGDDDIVVTTKDFESALTSIKPSVSDRDRIRYDHLNKRWSKASMKKEEQ
ncbi:Ribosome bioproteinsis ATPase rix7 [Brettanomyces nanus]|uniref:Ribosome bioproteinsis ATPase rix7 n=1 Tax=Eeniella nana TaxID=13502 RepID=A0A875RQK3_EENNA|nr:Ribosome biogenesis ATPase rix7 [Brettanomyces nanus]QPG77260.1 Ribosome bioproteinsis ATPase rix7 [Brettanomyces nanus]